MDDFVLKPNFLIENSQYTVTQYKLSFFLYFDIIFTFVHLCGYKSNLILK